MKYQCHYCEEGEACRPDPRDPPLDIGNRVLCVPCFEMHTDDCIAELEDQIRTLKWQRSKLRPAA